MCGRFSLASPADALVKEFGLVETVDTAPRYNIAPGQQIAIIRQPPAAEGRRLDLVRWGLVPWWTKEPTPAARMINARAETAAERPAFRDPFRARRCLVPADGFYEWQKSGARSQPFFIRRRDGRPMAFAALWDRWRGAAGERIESCALLTTRPNALVQPIHDRMPAILAPEQYAAWLDPSVTEPDRLLALLGPFPDQQLVAYPVSALVNDPRNDDPRCIAGVATTGSLF
jgi:putative SOS response-associated peptidase YedK